MQKQVHDYVLMKGFPAVMAFEFDRSPGQLVIYPLIPIANLNITQDDCQDICGRATLEWLKKHRIQTEISTLGLSTEKGQIAEISSSIQDGIVRGEIHLHFNDTLSFTANTGRMDSLAAHGVYLDLRESFGEWVLYFTNFLLERVPGSNSSPL